MKKRKILFLIILLSVGCQECRQGESPIKPGQIWIYESGNPRGGSVEHYVIDVQDGWVKYVQVKYKDEERRKIYEWETTEYMFRIGARLKSTYAASKEQSKE